MQTRNNYRLIMAFCTSLIITGGCKKFIEATPPKNQVIAATAFNDSSSALAALLHIYTKFGLSGGTIEGYFAPYPSLYTDELVPVNSNPDNLQYYTNGIHTDNSINAATWQSLYAVIYESNALVDGVEKSAGLSVPVKSQYTGEAKFLRAFAYFLLVNCYGDVPLAITTDVTITRSQPRTNKAEVYKQILKDLADAEADLGENYPTSGKIRANKRAAEALLAKVNLYLENWEQAADAATKVIQSNLYTPLEAPANVFLANSKEGILQVYENYGYTWSGNYFQPFFGSLNYALTPELLSVFEANDLRRQQWIDSADDFGMIDYYPVKYKNSGFITANAGEYTMCLRVAEQYLIRAEAECHENKTQDAIKDINTLRARAAIAPVPASVTNDACLKLIAEERRRELFTEWGNRFFDLKRTGRIDAVLSGLKPAWKPEAALYPIPQTEINYNSQLTQNPGY